MLQCWLLEWASRRCSVAAQQLEAMMKPQGDHQVMRELRDYLPRRQRVMKSVCGVAWRLLLWGEIQFSNREEMGWCESWATLRISDLKNSLCENEQMGWCESWATLRISVLKYSLCECEQLVSSAEKEMRAGPRNLQSCASSKVPCVTHSVSQQHLESLSPYLPFNPTTSRHVVSRAPPPICDTHYNFTLALLNLPQ